MKYIHLIWMLFLPLALFSQISSEKDRVRERIETAVEQGIITREQAEERYAKYKENLRRQNNVNTNKGKQNADLLTHYKKLGINNLSRIKKNLSNNGINDDQLDAVMRGMIRLIHLAKTNKDNYKLNPRMQNYFVEKLGLRPKEVQYVMDLSLQIAERIK